jgi:hypothetical protein
MTLVGPSEPVSSLSTWYGLYMLDLGYCINQGQEHWHRFCKHHWGHHLRSPPLASCQFHEVAAPLLEPMRSIRLRGQVDMSGRAVSWPAHHLESQGYPGPEVHPITESDLSLPGPTGSAGGAFWACHASAQPSTTRCQRLGLTHAAQLPPGARGQGVWSRPNLKGSRPNLKLT